MAYSKALTIANYCSLLITSDQVGFGVVFKMNQNVKLIPKINEEFTELNRLAFDKKAEKEEIEKAIEEFDKKYFAKFSKIEVSKIEDVKNELIPAFDENKKPITVSLQEILTFLQFEGIIYE